MLQPDLPPIIPRRCSAILSEEAVEIRRIAKAQAVSDLLDGEIELLQPRAGFADQPLVDDRARAAVLFALAMGVQLVGRDAERVRIARHRPAVAIMQLDHLQEIADQRRTATACRHDEAQMPFGGVKASGYGRFGGKAGIAEFTELRWITIETGPQHYPI